MTNVVLAIAFRRDRRGAEHSGASQNLVSRPHPRDLPPHPSRHVADREGSDRRRHGVVGRRSLLRQARLEQAARHPAPRLSAEEQAFLDGPVEELCAMCNDWEITHERQDLPPHVWQFIKDKGFLGMIIPKQYGGLGFSALAHSAVVMKLSTRSSTAAISVMVPNSLGPAELLLHYGTDEQKNHYLPRLAKGLEIPCFALTSPEAGSDAGSIPDYGIVCKGTWQGKRSARHARHLGQALHHARAGRDAARARVPALRPGPSARRKSRSRHHLRAGADQHARREHRPAPPAAQRRVPERAELGQGRVHADGLHHRRAASTRARLADADGLPRRRPLDLAARLVGRRRQGSARASPAPTRACAAVQAADRRSKASRKRSAASPATST